MSRDDLTAIAEHMGLEMAQYSRRKKDYVYRILEAQFEREGQVFKAGVLEILDEGGYGFLRGNENYLASMSDVYVSQSQVRRFGLRTGDYVTGTVRAPKDNEKYYSLLRVEAVNGVDPEVAKRRPHFEQLTAVFPDTQINLETSVDNLTQRMIDLVAPIGRGQRGLIVSPPKAGKTFVIKNIANGISNNYDDVHLMVLLIGERPEEVTDMRRSVDGEVVASTFDEPVEDHAHVAEMALERAKRLVEGGRDVVVLLDSITRMTRAYNLSMPPSGRTLSGGVDPIALYPPKRFFGAARNTDEGGSLTIIATCLVDTGSPHGRGHLRRVQGHRQHGAAPRTPPGGTAHLPGHRHRPQRHPSRRAAAQRRGPAPRRAHAPHDRDDRLELAQPDRGHGAPAGPPVPHARQRRVPRQAQGRAVTSARFRHAEQDRPSGRSFFLSAQPSGSTVNYAEFDRR